MRLGGLTLPTLLDPRPVREGPNVPVLGRSVPTKEVAPAPFVSAALAARS